MIDPDLTSTTPLPSSGKPGIGRSRRFALAVAAVMLAAGFALQPGNTFELTQNTDPNATNLREQRITKLVSDGDTLPRLLTDLGVSAAARNRWHNAVAKELGVNNVLKEGDAIHFYFTSEWNARDLGTLTALRIERAGLGRASWVDTGGELVYQRDKGPLPVLAAPDARAPGAPDEASARPSEAPAAPRPEAEPAPAAAPGQAAEPATAATAGAQAVKPVTHMLRKGETLGRVLRRYGLSANAQQPWIKAIGKRYRLNKLYPGRKIVLYFVAAAARDRGGRSLRAVQIESRGGDVLTWQWIDGRIVYRGKNHRIVLSKLAGAPAGAATAAPDALPVGTATAGPDAARARGVGAETAAAPTRGARAKPAAASTSGARANPVAALAQPATGAPDAARARAGNAEPVAAPAQAADSETAAVAGSATPATRAAKAAPAAAPGAPAGAPPTAAGTPVRPSGPSPPIRSFEPMDKVTHTVRAGQTLEQIFRRHGISGKKAAEWFEAIDRQFPVTRLRPGQRLHLYFEADSARRRGAGLKAVELEVRKERHLSWERVGKAIHFRRGRIPGHGQGSKTGAHSEANGADPHARENAFLSEYALARIKQRNGLLEYVLPSNDESNGSLRAPSLENTERVTHKLKRGEHLWGVLRRYEDNEMERRLWLTSLSRHKAVRRLRAGTNINLYFGRPADSDGATDNGSGATSGSNGAIAVGNGATGNGNGATSDGVAADNGGADADGDGAEGSNGSANHAFNDDGAAHIRALQVTLRSNLRLTWYRNEQDIVFYKDEVPYQQEVRSISGVVRSGSLYQHAKKAGADLKVISRMVDILGWDINFQRDLQPGDSYRVLYRRKYRAGHPEADRIRILAAEVVNAGRTHTAAYFEDADGEGHYYDADGRSVSRSFLRYPVEFRRISSRFSASRLHPVLKVRRPHYGVDFAARTGTPIRAVADGRITYRGWKGGYGRLVEISHGNAMKTRYAHLRGYGPGIRRGVSVQKGQTIGYVGCSGLCTGPHLHFEMWQDDRYVDPLRADIPVERRLDNLLLEIFKVSRQLFFEHLENGHESAAAPAPRPS